MGLFNLRTGKPLDGPEATVVSDLDAMVAAPIAFRLHGKVHHLKPITVKEFFAYSNAMLSLQRLEDAEKMSADQIIDLYFSLMSSVCESITHHDIKAMTQAQAVALVKLIIDHVTGKTQVGPEPEEKKSNNGSRVAI
jgi:hypothetical protein